jgi:uncharacterized protein (DUF983 family)
MATGFSQDSLFSILVSEGSIILAYAFMKEVNNLKRQMWLHLIVSNRGSMVVALLATSHAQTR